MASEARIVRVFCGTASGVAKTSINAARLLAGHGLQGDSHAGRDARRHVSLFANEVLRAIQSEGFNVQPGELSANLFTENLPLDDLLVGAQLRIGSALLEIVEMRKPCRSITKLDHRLPKRLIGHCGQLARVVQEGIVSLGDVIECGY